MKILELKNTVSKIKNSKDGLNSKMEETEEKINELEDRTIEITQSEQQRENRWKKKLAEPQGQMGL